MADAAKADVTSGTRFLMKHRSGRIQLQPADLPRDGAFEGDVDRPYRHVMVARRRSTPASRRSPRPAPNATRCRSRPRTNRRRGRRSTRRDGRDGQQRGAVDEHGSATSRARTARLPCRGREGVDVARRPKRRRSHERLVGYQLQRLPRPRQRRRLGPRHQQQPAPRPHQLDDRHQRGQDDLDRGRWRGRSTRSTTWTSTSPVGTAASATRRSAPRPPRAWRARMGAGQVPQQVQHHQPSGHERHHRPVQHLPH